MTNASTDDAQVHCLKITEPKLVLVDVTTAGQLAKLAPELKSKGVGPIHCWSSVAHLPQSVQDVVGQIGKPDPKVVQEVIDGVGVEKLGPDSDGIIFFTSG